MVVWKLSLCDYKTGDFSQLKEYQVDKMDR